MGKAGAHEAYLGLQTRPGEVHIDVMDAEHSLSVWRDLLGLEVMHRDEHSISLGAGGNLLIVLYPGAVREVVRKSTGLYHVALHIPTRRDLAIVVRRLFTSHYPNYPTDHIASEATYLSDPDGNEIEVTFSTPHKGSFVLAPGGEPAVLDSHGILRPATGELDLQSLLAELEDGDQLDVPLPAGTRVGHLHLKVRDLEPALKFYRDIIGFQEQLYSPKFGMADLTLSGYAPHILALNTWESRGAAPAPEGSSGLRYFTVHVERESDLEGLRIRLSESGTGYTETDGGLSVRDPSGNALQVRLSVSIRARA